MDNEKTTTERLHIPTREVATWVYVLALAVVAGAGWAFFTHGTVAHAKPQLPWWAVALGFACAEICVVHVRFRRSAHSFSLADLPFVFGLVFASGDAFVLGALVGTGIVWGLVRRLPVVKVVFNLAQIALTATSAAIILHLIAGGAAMDHPQTWVGLYTASLSSGALTILLLSAAIQISEGSLKREMMAQMFATDALVTLINASIAIAAALVVANDARAVPVLLIPALTVFAVYRAYISERQRHERLEFLYDANRTLSRSPEVAEALEALLARSLEAFNADVAEALLFTADGDAAAHHARPRRPPRDDGAGRPRDRRRARRLRRRREPRRLPHPAVRLPAPARPHAGPRHPPRDDRHAPRRGAHDRHDHARQPRRPRALLRRRRPAPAGGARQQRRGRAPVRPARAGRQQARGPAGPAAPPGLPRPAHGPPEPHAVHGARAPGARRRRRGRGAVRGRRRLQDDQRLARPFRRRRAARLRGRADARVRAPRGHDRPPRRRRVRGDDPRRRRPAGRRPRRRPPHPEGVRAARRGRHRAGLRAPVRRPRVQPPVRRRRRRADPQRRRRHVPGEVQGQGALRALRAADGRRDPPSPRHEGRAGEGDRAPADDRPVPADRRAGHGQDRRRRGARPLGAPGARPRAARRVRAARRGDRADRAARALRAQRGLPAGPPLAGRRPGRRPSRCACT